MINLLDKEYFEWMYQIVCDDASYISYRKLLRNLHDTEFVWLIDMDSNRASDGISLRYRFGYDLGYSRNEIDDYFGDVPCSVLEMMIALALSIEEHIMSDPSIGDRTGQWFWNMIASLGLLGMSDKKYNENFVNRKIDIFLSRKYKKNGDGGLFAVQDPRLDMREPEIWYQVTWYLDENFDFTL